MSGTGEDTDPLCLLQPLDLYINSLFEGSVLYLSDCVCQLNCSFLSSSTVLELMGSSRTIPRLNCDSSRSPVSPLIVSLPKMSESRQQTPTCGIAANPVREAESETTKRFRRVPLVLSTSASLDFRHQHLSLCLAGSRTSKNNAKLVLSIYAHSQQLACLSLPTSFGILSCPPTHCNSYNKVPGSFFHGIGHMHHGAGICSGWQGCVMSARGLAPRVVVYPCHCFHGRTQLLSWTWLLFPWVISVVTGLGALLAR